MMLYLTGAGASLSKSIDNPQTDASKSLGGYISSTLVPNADINSIFDMISAYTLEKKQTETIAIGLINKLDVSVKDVEIKIVTKDENVSFFKVAAVRVGADYAMEKIANRYQEPMAAEFHDATFYRASVDVEINQCANAGDIITFLPFNISASVKKDGMEGTMDAIEEAFLDDENYEMEKLSLNRFRVLRKDETVVKTPIQCSYTTTGGFTASFLSDFKNKKEGSAFISAQMLPDEAIGLWIQRGIKKQQYTSNDDLLNEYREKVVKETTEGVDIVISYTLGDKPANYEKPKYDKQYS